MSDHRYVIDRDAGGNVNSTNSVATTAELEGESKDDGPCRREAKAFVGRTTIPGISHCNVRHQLPWRLAWVAVIVAGLVMAGFQSREVINDFIGDSIVQVISFKVKDRLYFPAITLCSNMMVDLNQNGTPVDARIARLVERADNVTVSYFDRYPFTTLENKIDGFRSEIMNLMAHWDDKRIANTFGNHKFFQDCQWKSTRCNYSKDFYSFFNLRYGKCMTFNAGFTKQSMMKAGSEQGFTGILDMNLESRSRVINADYAVVFVHPSSYPPVVTLDNVIRIHPGERLRIFVQGKSVNSEKVAKIKSCIPAEETVKSANGMYHTETTPYTYSEQACYAECRFRKRVRHETHPCLDPSLPLHSVTQAVRQGPVRAICNYTDFLSDVEIPFEACEPKCLKHCKQPVLLPVPTTTPLERVSVRLLETVSGNNSNNNKKPINPIDTIMAHHAVVQVVFASTEYMKVIEEPKYSYADFFGMFGGNLSLWVGVNIICLVELIEFLVLLVLCKFTGRHSEPCYCNWWRRRTPTESTQSIAGQGGGGGDNHPRHQTPKISTIEMR